MRGVATCHLSAPAAVMLPVHRDVHSKLCRLVSLSDPQERTSAAANHNSKRPWWV